jgi:signal transduction histidine kinase
MFRKDAPVKNLVDIDKVIRTVLDLVRIELQRHRIDVRTDLNYSLPMVTGNSVQLQQVILNLVMNAIESMYSANSRVLTVRSDLTVTGEIEVSIEDTGSGIDPSDFPRVFDPLFTTKGSGMGMGLAICRSIIENHGGRISASSGSNGGSVFRFALPGPDRTGRVVADSVSTLVVF